MTEHTDLGSGMTLVPGQVLLDQARVRKDVVVKEHEERRPRRAPAGVAGRRSARKLSLDPPRSVAPVPHQDLQLAWLRHVGVGRHDDLECLDRGRLGVKPVEYAAEGRSSVEGRDDDADPGRRSQAAMAGRRR